MSFPTVVFELLVDSSQFDISYIFSNKISKQSKQHHTEQIDEINTTIHKPQTTNHKPQSTDTVAINKQYFNIIAYSDNNTHEDETNHSKSNSQFNTHYGVIR